MLKKLLFLAVLVFAWTGLASAQYTLTPNISLKKPNPGITSGWDTYINGDMDTIDTYMNGVAKRTCDIVIGDVSGSAISDAQLGPQYRLCQVQGASTLLQVTVSSNNGTPSVIVGRSRCTTFTTGVCTAETRVNLLSGALSAATGGFDACSNTGGTTGFDGGTTCTNTLQNTTLNKGDYIELVSGTAGGVAKLMTIHVVYAQTN